MREDRGRYSNNPSQYGVDFKPSIYWETQGTSRIDEHPIDLSMTACACCQCSGHQRNAARGATEVSVERGLSASGTAYFLPALELQEPSAVRTADYTGEISALPSTDNEGDAPNTDNRGMGEISIQEEIQKVAREKYLKYYKELSSWLGEFPTCEEMVRELGAG